MPDIVNLIIWLVAGIAGGNAAGDLLKGHYDLGLAVLTIIAGAVTRWRQNRRPNSRG